MKGLSTRALLGFAGLAAAVAVLVAILLGGASALYGIRPVWAFLTAHVGAVSGPIAGFVTAWVIFEITERRKARMAQAAMRTAILGELQHAELLLSTIVVGYAFGPTGTGIPRAVSEMRWLLAPDRGKLEEVGFFEATGETEPVLQSFRGRSDSEIAGLLAAFPSRAAKRPLEVHVPVIAGVLRQPQAGFTERQVQLLASVRWQLQLLNDGARWAHRFFRMTFTIADPTNHAIAVANYNSCRDEHRQRAAWALDEVRDAIEVLRAGPRCVREP